MEPDAGAYIRKLLEPDEQLLWAGTPRAGIRINTRGKSFRLSAAILVLIIAVVALGPSVTGGRFFGPSLFVAVILFLVMYAVATPMLMEIYGPRAVDYGLTNRRAIVAHRTANEASKSYSVRAFRSFGFDHHWDGRATLYVAIASPDWPSADPSAPHPLFHFVDDHEGLHARLTQLRPDLRSGQETLSADDEAYLRRLLQPDEQLLWWERPPAGLRRRGNDLLQALMALLLIIVPIVCIKAVIDTRDARREGVGEISNAAMTFIVVTGIVLMLKGLWQFARYFRDAGSRNSALYALTTQRAIVAKHPNEFGTAVRSIQLGSVTDIGIAWERDGRGTISCRGEALEWKIPNANKGSYQKLWVRGSLFRSIECPEEIVTLMDGSQAALSSQTPLATFTGSKSAARLERLPGETIRWLGTSDDARNGSWIAAWWAECSRWARDLLRFLGVSDQIGRRQTSVLHGLPIPMTRTLEYMLTDRRVVIIDPGYEHGVRRIPLDSLDRLFLQMDRHGKETIFARSNVRDWPYRDAAGNSVAGPLLPGIDWSPSVFAMMAADFPSLPQHSGSETGSTAARQIRNWLRDHETLIWTGRPLPGYPMSSLDFWFFALLIAYLLIGAGLVGRAWQRQSSFAGEAATISPLAWGLLGAGVAALLLYGLYRTYLRFLLDPHAWKSTVYGLTDRRVIVQTDRWIQSVPLHRLGYLDLQMQESRKGSLACRIGSTSWLVFEELSARCEQAWPFDGYLFKDIRDPQQAASLIAATRWQVR